MPFEDDLKIALARQDPSADFTQRVLARAAAQEKRGACAWLRAVPAWRLAALAASLFALTGAAIYHDREQRGEAAKRQLLVAMQIAGEKLHGAQQQVMEFDSKFNNKEVAQ